MRSEEMIETIQSIVDVDTDGKTRALDVGGHL